MSGSRTSERYGRAASGCRVTRSSRSKRAVGCLLGRAVFADIGHGSEPVQRLGIEVGVAGEGPAVEEALPRT